MISLLLSEGIGTWIAIEETYYLCSMAFSAANLSIFTRLISVLAFTVVGGLIRLIVISASEGIRSGVLFIFYLVKFTAYLSTLPALCSFQFTGSSFLDG